MLDSMEFDNKSLSKRHFDEIVKQVNHGLDELQSYGLRHNDLRPQNVLVFDFSHDDASATKIKICDFEDVRTGPRDDIETFVELFKKLI